MHESLRGIPAQVREQFGILVDNIKTLTQVRQEVGSGPVGDQVDREVLLHISALGELRERVFLGAVSGHNISPLEKLPSRVEILDLSDLPLVARPSSSVSQLSH